MFSQSNEFGLIISSVADGTMPTATLGTAVTPGNNAYGAYATLIAGASVTDDAYEIEININNVGISAAARDCVVSIGLDAAGGTSFTSLVDLVCGPASPYLNGANGGAGVNYKFPLFIKAGTSIGAAAAVNSATLTAISVSCRVRCRPMRPDAVRVGKYIDQFGVALASSSGTAITPGSASEGTYTQMGAALTRPCWFWEFGYGINDSTMQNNVIHVDVAIGDGVSFKQVIQNAMIITTAVETLVKPSVGYFGHAATGDKVYARAQSGPNAPDSLNSVAVYGVGG